MPKSCKIVLWVNSALIVLTLGILFSAYSVIGAQILIALSSWTLVGALLLCQWVIAFKARRLWNILRGVLYVTALLQALSLLILSQYFLTVIGFISLLITLLIIIYLIGLRGYLNSKDFLSYFTELGVKS